MVAAGAVATYRAQRSAYRASTDAAQIHEAGMNALMLVGEQVQMAGFVPADWAANPVVTPVFGCSAARPTGTGDALACETLAGRSDGLAIRYVGDGESTWLSSTGQVTDCLGQAVSATDAAGVAGVTGVAGTTGTTGALVTNRYYAKASGSTGEPELYCEGSGHAGTAQPLVEGVEQLRVRYWLAGAAQPVDASAIARDQWPRVAAVDLCVLVRGAALGKRARYTSCDGMTSVSTDGRARQTFWRHVTLRNRQEVIP